MSSGLKFFVSPKEKKKKKKLGVLVFNIVLNFNYCSWVLGNKNAVLN